MLRTGIKQRHKRHGGRMRRDSAFWRAGTRTLKYWPHQEGWLNRLLTTTRQIMRPTGWSSRIGAFRPGFDSFTGLFPGFYTDNGWIDGFAPDKVAGHRRGTTRIRRLYRPLDLRHFWRRAGRLSDPFPKTKGILAAKIVSDSDSPNRLAPGGRNKTITMTDGRCISLGKALTGFSKSPSSMASNSKECWMAGYSVEDVVTGYSASGKSADYRPLLASNGVPEEKGYSNARRTQVLRDTG